MLSNKRIGQTIQSLSQYALILCTISIIMMQVDFIVLSCSHYNIILQCLFPYNDYCVAPPSSIGTPNCFIQYHSSHCSFVTA